MYVYIYIYIYTYIILYVYVYIYIYIYTWGDARDGGCRGFRGGRGGCLSLMKDHIILQSLFCPTITIYPTITILSYIYPTISLSYIYPKHSFLSALSF